MTPQPQTAAPTQTVPRTPVGAFGRYLGVLGTWLKKNLKEALMVALVGFVIGWVINFVLMAFFYDGFRADETMAATGQGNVRNGMLIWSLFSSVAFGLVAYRRAVGKERFRHDLANFPGAIVGVFKKDGDAIWTHILWGAAISLLATFLIARWAGLGVAMVVTAVAFSPLGLILAAMITQLWRAIMRSLMPMKTRRATGSAGLFVGLFTSSLVLLAGFFITNEREKLILGALCLVAAVVVGRRQAPPPAVTALLLIAPLLWLLFPELGFADDGGFKEAGGDFGAWARGGGLEEITGYSGYGGVAGAVGGLTGWMIGTVNGISPPPEGGWDAGLEGEPDLDPGGSPAGDGLPPMTTPIGEAAAGPDIVSDLPDAAGDPAAPDPHAEPPAAPDEAATAEAAPEDAPTTAVEPPAPTVAPAAPATPRADGELTDDEIAAMSEEEYRAWRARGASGDPDSPGEVMRRAMAGDPEAAARWEEIKGEGDPSFLDRAASVVLGPVYDAIGGSETLIELAKTDWIDEGLDTAAALRDAAGRRIGQIADTAVETARGAYELSQMDASELAGMAGQIQEDVANSAVGQTVTATVEGIAELSTMDADELAALAGQVRDDAAEAVVERVEQVQTLVEGMTVEEALGHLDRTRDAVADGLSDADRAIRRQAQEIMRMNPDTVRAALADGTIAVVEELVVEVATGGLGAARHADDVVDLVRTADNAVDAARAAENTTDAARGVSGASDTARAGTPDAPPVRDTPDAPDAPATPDTPDTPRAEAADPAAPSDPGPERRGPGPTDGGRRDPNAAVRDADGPVPDGAPPRAAEPEPPAAETPGGRTGPGDTVELDPRDGPGGVRPPGERPRGPGDTMELDPSEGPGGVRPPGERPRGPGDTVELDPGDGPGGVRPPDAPRQPTAAPPEPPAGSPPGRSNEPWTEADTVRTPRRSVETPGDTDPGRPPARPASPATDAPNAPDGDLVFEMEDGKRVNMTTNRPEPPRPGSPADLAGRGDAPATPPRADPGADTLADGPPPARPPDQPDGDLVFEMEDGKRVNMTTNRPEPPRPGSPADPAVRADTQPMPAVPPARPASGATPDLPDAAPPGRTGPGGTQRLDPDDLPDGRTGPGGTQRLDPDDLPDGRTGPGGTQRLDPDDLPDARTGPGGTQRLDPDDLPDGSPQPGDRAPRPRAEREALANEAYDGPRGLSGQPPRWPDGTRRPPDLSDAAPGDLPRSSTPRDGHRTDMDDPPYADDPNIDADGRPIPEDVAEGSTLPPLPDGHWENPLDKAYVDVTAPERSAPGIGRGAPEGRDDAIRAAHERYQTGVEQARANLDNPAFRERMNPEAIRDLEEAVDPANARSLEDFRRSAGMDPTPPPRAVPSPPRGPDAPPMRDGPPAPPDDTPTVTPGRPGPAFTEGDTVLNPGRGARPDPDLETMRNPGRGPAERTGPGGTQRLDPDDLPDGRTGPGGTQRLDPADLPDGRTGPGGTQRLDPDDLPDGRTGPGGTQRLDPDDLPDGRTGPGGTRRLDPDDLPDGRTGPGGTQRLDPDDLPSARTGPGGTQRLDPDDLPSARTGPEGTQRLDPPDLPEARTGPGGTQRLESGDLPDGRRGAPVDRAPAGPGEEVRPGIRRAPDGTHQVRMPRSEAERILGDAEPGGRPPALDETIPGDQAEAARRANAQFQEGMERARRDLDDRAPESGAPPEASPADEPPARRSRRAPRVEEPSQPPPASRAPDPDPAPSRPAPAEPEAPPEAVEEPGPRPRRRRAEPFSRAALPDVPDTDFRRYEDVIGRARQDGLRAAGDWPSGGCEEAKLSLLKQVEGQPGWEGRAALVGPPGKAFDHEFAVSPEGHIVDPVARQFVDRGIWTDARLRRAGLLDAVNRGIFTPDQWARFTFARPQANI